MNKKLLALIAVGLLAGPLGANAATSTCTFEDDVLECDLYESGGSTVIDLGEFIDPTLVGEGAVGILDNDMMTIRNVVEFITENGSSFLYFYFRVALPPVDEQFLIQRTGDVTTFGTNFTYNVFHDYQPDPVPEPGSLALLGLGLVGLGLVRRRAK